MSGGVVKSLRCSMRSRYLERMLVWYSDSDEAGMV